MRGWCTQVFSGDVDTVKAMAQEDVAALHPHLLRGGGGVEVRDGDGVARRQRTHALVASHVEEDAAADELVLGPVDAVPGRAAARHERGVDAVVHLPLVKDVGEAVPLGHALERHHDPVVRAAVALLKRDNFERTDYFLIPRRGRLDPDATASLGLK